MSFPPTKTAALTSSITSTREEVAGVLVSNTATEVLPAETLVAHTQCLVLAHDNSKFAPPRTPIGMNHQGWRSLALTIDAEGDA